MRRGEREVRVDESGLSRFADWVVALALCLLLILAIVCCASPVGSPAAAAQLAGALDDVEAYVRATETDPGEVERLLAWRPVGDALVRVLEQDQAYGWEQAAEDLRVAVVATMEGLAMDPEDQLLVKTALRAAIAAVAASQPQEAIEQ